MEKKKNDDERVWVWDCHLSAARATWMRHITHTHTCGRARARYRVAQSLNHRRRRLRFFFFRGCRCFQVRRTHKRLKIENSMDPIVYYNCARARDSIVEFWKGKIISIRRWRTECHTHHQHKHTQYTKNVYLSSRLLETTRGYCPPRSQIYSFHLILTTKIPSFAKCIAFGSCPVASVSVCVCGWVRDRLSVVPENDWKIESDRRRSDAERRAYGSIANVCHWTRRKLRANNKIEKKSMWLHHGTTLHNCRRLCSSFNNKIL